MGSKENWSVGQQGTLSIQRERALPKAFLFGEPVPSLSPVTLRWQWMMVLEFFILCLYNTLLTLPWGQQPRPFHRTSGRGNCQEQKKHFKLIWSYTDTKLIVFLYLFLYRKFSQNTVAQLWYFVKCVYFGLSAYQIRCGYPTRVLGNFLTKSYNYVNLFLFQG